MQTGPNHTTVEIKPAMQRQGLDQRGAIRMFGECGTELIEEIGVELPVEIFGRIESLVALQSVLPQRFSDLSEQTTFVGFQ